MAPVTPEAKAHLPSETARLEKISKVSPSCEDHDPVYDRLINEAPYMPSDQREFHCLRTSDLTWIDPKLIIAGQQFVSRNFFSLICAHLGALLYGFSFKSLSTLLLRTGNSSNVEVSLIRYLSTFLHLKTWYESNVIAEGYADVQQVKKMHLLALKQYRRAPLQEVDLKTLYQQIDNPRTVAIMQAVRSDLSPIPTPDVPRHLITYFPVVPMSQFDMVMTQFGVISLVYLFPGVLGINDTKGIDGFLHLWAIIGKLLGIHDRFNLALYPSELLYRKIFTNIGIGSLKDSDLIVIHLQEVLIEGVAKYAHYTTHKSLLYFGLTRNHALTNYKGQELRRLLTFKDVACYWLMRILLGSVYNFPLIRICVNCVARRALNHAKEKYLMRKNPKLIGNEVKVVTKYEKLFIFKKTNVFNCALLIGTTIVLLLVTFF